MVGRNMGGGGWVAAGVAVGLGDGAVAAVVAVVAVVDVVVVAVVVVVAAVVVVVVVVVVGAVGDYRHRGLPLPWCVKID